MVDKLKNELRPFLVVLWWVGPSSEDFTVRKIVTIRFGMCGQSLRHESKFYQGLDACGVKRIKNPVQDRPIVDRPSIRIFRIHIGRAPFQSGRSIASGQQIVHAYVNRRRTEG